MVFKRKNTIHGLQLKFTGFMLFLGLQFCAQQALAQETKTATIKLDFVQADSSTKTCKVTVTSDSLPIKEKEIHLYVKGLYTLLPIGKPATTDEAGVAEIKFPTDLPGDKNGMITVIARIEKDEIFGTVETQSEVKWGFKSKNEAAHWNDRSLSASREKAPMFLVVASSLIIMIIWGTIFYVVFQLFKIKKSGKIITKLNSAIS